MKQRCLISEGWRATVFCLALASLLPGFTGCRAFKLYARRSCTCGLASCPECGGNPHQLEAARAVAQMLPLDASESYRAGFCDGYGDQLGAQARRDWAAGFQHGFDAAQGRDLSLDDRDGGYTQPEPTPATIDIWDEPLPGFDQLAPVLDSPEVKRESGETPFEASPPRRVPLEDPIDLPDTTQPSPTMPTAPDQQRPQRGPTEPEPRDPFMEEAVPGPTMDATPDGTALDNDLADPFQPPATVPPTQPGPSPEQPGEPLPDDDSELDFDDLFADPDADNSGAHSRPTKQQLGIPNGAAGEVPQFTIRFKEDPPLTAPHSRSPRGRSDQSRSVSFQTPVTTRSAPAQRPSSAGARGTSTQAAGASPQSGISRMFQTSSPPSQRLREATELRGSFDYSRQFTVDQDQRVIVDDD